jgi:hypothetical protein
MQKKFLFLTNQPSLFQEEGVGKILFSIMRTVPSGISVDKHLFILKLLLVKASYWFINMRTISQAILIFLFIVICQSEIISLNQDNFQAEISKHEFSLVKFFEHWW